jgi:pimeloyl-ACP methyl ester carboxylesterase
LKAFYFGPDARRLLGALHSPQRLRPRSAAVLLCNPFGEEAARAHRSFRVLANQLERLGYPVLRFDYGGTGDSMGESDDVSLDGWLADVGHAADELAAASGGKKLVAVGLRLGATLAALATARGRLRPRHLVLWDPVVDGGGYLRELSAMHASYMRSEMGAAGWQDRRRAAAGVPTEALGSPISAAFARELGALDLAAEELRSDHVTVVRTREGDEAERLRGKLAAAAWIDLPASVSWNSDVALNSQVVPMDVVQAIVGRIEELSP